jgi:hypothetical protein
MFDSYSSPEFVSLITAANKNQGTSKQLTAMCRSSLGNWPTTPIARELSIYVTSVSKQSQDIRFRKKVKIFS